MNEVQPGGLDLMSRMLISYNKLLLLKILVIIGVVLLYKIIGTD